MAANICYKEIKCKECHHYQYDEDKGYVCLAKGKEFLPNQEQLENKSYELYKLRWLMEHKITLEDIENQLHFDLECFNSSLNESEYYENIIDTLIEELTNGVIYACKDEFLNNEFRDKQYMMELLKKNEGLWMSYIIVYNTIDEKGK